MRSRIWVPETGIKPFYINTRKQFEAEISAPPIPLSGRFEILKRRRGEDWRKVADFPNLITNAGLNRVGAWNGGQSDIAGLRIGVGTGGTAPDVTDTSLQTIVGSHLNPNTTYSSASAVSSSSEMYVTKRWGTLFDYSQGNGNLTEVGTMVAYADILWCRSLIKDSGGSPTTIVKTSDEQLIVYYTMRRDFFTGSMQGTITLDGSDYDWEMRYKNTYLAASNNSGVNGAEYWPVGGTYFAAVYGFSTWQMATYENVTLVTNPWLPGPVVSGGSYALPGAQMTFQSYTNDTFQRDILYNFDASVSNYTTGIGGFVTGPAPYISGSAGLQCKFTPSIPKTNTQRLQLYIRTAWNRGPVFDRFPSTPDYP